MHRHDHGPAPTGRLPVHGTHLHPVLRQTIDDGVALVAVTHEDGDCLRGTVLTVSILLQPHCQQLGGLAQLVGAVGGVQQQWLGPRAR